MIAENSLALHYLLADDIYLLGADKPYTGQGITELLAAPNEADKSELPTETVIKAAVTLEAPLPHAATAITDAPVPVIVPESAPTFNYLGGNQKRFLILVNYPGLDFMDDAHLKALTSTINKRELALSDVAIFNISGYPAADFGSLYTFFKPEKLLVLGVAALPKGLPPIGLNISSKQQNCDMLYSYSFAEMMGNRDNTKAFWEQMKNL